MLKKHFKVYVYKINDCSMGSFWNKKQKSKRKILAHEHTLSFPSQTVQTLPLLAS